MDDQRWIDLLDPDSTALSAVLPDSVHESALGRLLAPAHDGDPRPRLETHDDYVIGTLVIPFVGDHGGEVDFQEIDVLVTIERLITVRKTPPGAAAFDIATLRTAALAGGAAPGMCLYLLFAEVAEHYLSVIDQFDDSIDALEDEVETLRASSLREQISQLRHDILHVRRVLAPTRDAARSVLDDRVELTGAELFPREVEIHFADVYDKLLRATDGLDLARDLLAGVRDYHQAQVANDQNEVVKRLTVIASVLLLPTFIVGMYGQNLKGIPEFGFRYGYAWSWGLIVLTTVAQLVYFRRKRWI